MQSAAYAVLIDDRGQALVEYALVIALVAVVAVASMRLFGQKVNNNLGSSSQLINAFS
jgi:Flp pilus assembly pilin Flp